MATDRLVPRGHEWPIRVWGNEYWPDDPDIAWLCNACSTTQQVGADFRLLSHADPLPVHALGAKVARCSHGLVKPRYQVCPGSGALGSYPFRIRRKVVES